MRIEIGPRGKIIGTRRVSPNGQVSGLSEYAGQEVLVILPGGSESEAAPGWGSPEAVAQVVEGQVRQAYQQYELLRELYATPWEATRSFMRSAFPGSWPDLAVEVDRWVKDQLQNSGEASPRSPGSAPRGTVAASGDERRTARKKRVEKADEIRVKRGK